jgi:hypothetical protein
MIGSPIFELSWYESIAGRQAGRQATVGQTIKRHSTKT